MLLPLIRIICRLWTDVKCEFSDLGEFSLVCTRAQRTPHQFRGQIRAGQATPDSAGG